MLMAEELPLPTPTLTVEAIRSAVLRLYCLEDISVVGKLGSGFYANVYLVYHRPSKHKLALKISPSGNIQRREIEILRGLRHENVQRLFGACIIGGKLACLTEYANGGSLADLLTANSAPLPWSCRVSLAHDIIRGLSHLHENRLIHRDLSSQNILIRVNCDGTMPLSTPLPAWMCNRNGSGGEISTSSQIEPSLGLSIDQMTELWDSKSPLCAGLPVIPPSVAPTNLFHRYHRYPPYTAVVGDLGVCLDLRQRNVDATIIAGSAYCTAPECLRKLAPYSPAADIFAFGLLVCELIVRLVNNGSTIPRTAEFGLDKDNLPVPPDCPPWFLDLAVDCCKVNHLERPSVEEITDRIIGHSIDSSFIGPRAFNFVAVEKNGAAERSARKRFTGSALRGAGSQQIPTAAATVPPDCLG
ncbi:LIM domain kinase 2 [Taenia crassiceps]|uniref:LIM domain kinase 2 n=1 Tax=Taenia crassiceps TaxID=6207 RepID=A0ABR4Q938_9CEST